MTATDVAEAPAPAQDQTAAPQPPRSSVYENSKALAVRHSDGAAVPMPTSFAQMQDFASTMARAGAMVGLPFRDNPGACLGILTQALRWGMDPYAVSQKAYVASRDGNGPIAYEGQLVAAVVAKNAPLQKRLRCTYEGDGDDRRITIIGFLDQEPEPFEYRSPTVSKLKKEKGKGSPLWHDDPDQQLWYYGVRAWARKWTPDVIMGVYTPDELGEIARGDREADAGDPITLGSVVSAASEGVDGPVRDAEFTPIDGLLNRAAKENGAPKDAAKPLGDGGVSGETRQPKGKRAKAEAGSQPAAPAADAKPAPEAAATPQDPAPSKDESSLMDIETQVRESRQGKRQLVLDNREFLEGVSKADPPHPLKARADKLLNMFDLDDPA